MSLPLLRRSHDIRFEHMSLFVFFCNNCTQQQLQLKQTTYNTFNIKPASPHISNIHATISTL